MRNEAVIDGVTISRQQAEQALAEMNKKPTAKDKHGMVRTYSTLGPRLLLDPAEVRRALESAEAVTGMVLLGPAGDLCFTYQVNSNEYPDAFAPFTIKATPRG